MFARFLRPLA